MFSQYNLSHLYIDKDLDGGIDRDDMKEVRQGITEILNSDN